MFGQLLGLTSFFEPVDWRVCVLAMIPLLIDWSAQTWLSLPSTNLRRLFTGLLAGYGEVALAIIGLQYFLARW
jgi:uncharacterized membrane protein